MTVALSMLFTCSSMFSATVAHGRGCGMDAAAVPARPAMFRVLPRLPVGLDM